MRTTSAWMWWRRSEKELIECETQTNVILFGGILSHTETRLQARFPSLSARVKVMRNPPFLSVRSSKTDPRHPPHPAAPPLLVLDRCCAVVACSANPDLVFSPLSDPAHVVWICPFRTQKNLDRKLPDPVPPEGCGRYDGAVHLTPPLTAHNLIHVLANFCETPDRHATLPFVCVECV